MRAARIRTPDGAAKRHSPPSPLAESRGALRVSSATRPDQVPSGGQSAVTVIVESPLRLLVHDRLRPPGAVPQAETSYEPATAIDGPIAGSARTRAITRRR